MCKTPNVRPGLDPGLSCDFTSNEIEMKEGHIYYIYNISTAQVQLVFRASM